MYPLLTTALTTFLSFTQIAPGDVDGELVVTTDAGARGLVLVGTPRPGALAESGHSLALWNGSLEPARRHPFTANADGSASLALCDAERAVGTVVQVVLVDRDGGLVEVARAGDLPSALVQPPTLNPGGGPAYTVSSASTGARSGLYSVPPGTVEDLPDELFRDLDADGIDGSMARAVFVDWATGALVAAGDMSDPLSDVQAAIDMAFATPGLDHVYVSAGTYAGELVLRDGVSIWGGYDALDGWSRAADHVTTFHNQAAGADGLVGVRAENLTQPTTLGDVTVTTGTAPTGMHNYGVKAWQAYRLRLERVSVRPGPGGVGTAAPNASGVTSRYSGGAGGAGGSPSYGAGKNGKAGTGPGGAPGAGGSGTNNGKSGSDGGNGSTVGFGAPASNVCSAPGSVLICLNSGSKGPDGNRGGGGGGGGGGGAGLVTSGGKGGKGGSGGGAGYGGYGGFGGGSSIAVFASASKVVAIDCDLTSGAGGAGGAGGSGSTGQGGLNGSSGQTVSGVSKGGSGGDGGDGSSGGKGGGGGGGHSFALVRGPGATTKLVDTVLTPGPGGLGGAPNGPTGQAVGIKQL